MRRGPVILTLIDFQLIIVGYWLVGCRTDIVGYPTYTKAAGSQRREEVSQSYKWKNTLRSNKNKVARHLHLEHHPQSHLGDDKDVF
jgi:hypothetical protein